MDQESEEEPIKISSDLQYSANIGERNKVNTTSTPEQRARARLASPKLVILYAQATPRNSYFNSNQIFIDFIINLSKTAQEEQDPALSAKAAIALLRTLASSLTKEKKEQQSYDSTEKKFGNKYASKTLSSPELQSVIPILRNHPAFSSGKHKNIITKVLKQIEKTSSESSDSTMDSSFAGGNASSSSAIADRITPGSDRTSSIANLLSDVGPACTSSDSTFRETLNEFRRSFVIDESVMARMLFFFSSKGKDSNCESSSSGISSSLLGSLLPGRTDENLDAGAWNLGVIQQVIACDYQSGLDWNIVARKWDFYDFVIRDSEQFRTLIDLYRAGAQHHPPIAALTSQWQNSASQCSLLEAIMSVPASVFMCELSDVEQADAVTAGSDSQILTAVPNPRCWACSSVLQCLLYLTEVPSISRRVRDLFIKGLLSCPEVILCALIRLSLNQTSEASANAGKQMKSECMRELVPLFFKPNSGHRVQNGPAACRRMWEISPNTFTAACIEGWRSTAADSPQARLTSIVHIISIVRLLTPPPAPETALKSLLEGQDPEFSIALYFVLADKANYQLKSWLAERVGAGGNKFVGVLITYLAKFYQTASPRSENPLVSLENMNISLQVLLTLDSSVMSKGMINANGGENSSMTISDSVKSLTEACVQTYPSLRASLSQALNNPGSVEQTPQQQSSVPGSSTADDDIEEKANSYFQKIYTSEQSIGEIVEMLKRFKTSNDSRENDIFQCMIRNLFDEYRFFSKYPEKELRITGILFGTLIKEQLVSSITLGIALRYVLEALRRPPSPAGSTTSSSGKMFRFGMFALEQFKERLHEWPQYCSHIVQIPHLKDGYADLLSEIETAMTESQNRNNQSDTLSNKGSDTGSTRSFGSESLPRVSTPTSTAMDAVVPSLNPRKETRVAKFGVNLGRAVTDEVNDDIQHEAPPDAVLDRVQFLINNVSLSNVELKSKELKDMLEPRYFDWLGHYLVVKRISAQPNFHSLYLAFLDNLGDYGKSLILSILSSVYLNIGKLLRSPKITTSTSERSLLKNLGSWLGQITIARNRPILQVMLDCKELLFQGYENGRLIAVTPFVAKILEGAKSSSVFRPPNPWVMGLLGVFRALYAVEDLKMNIKFEVEVLCKNLGIKLDEIPPRSDALAKRIPPVKERNPDFNMKSSMVTPSSAPSTPTPNDPPSSNSKVQSAFPSTPQIGGLGQIKHTPSKEQQTAIPHLASYVTINPNLTALIQQAQGTTLTSSMSATTLQRSVPIAVDRAIREIMKPVVERSVTIACITTKEIVTKDFATEGDENKMLKAAQLMVANLAGSLALVTCRDPLRNSVSTHLRQLLTSAVGGLDKLTEQEQSTIEQCVAIVANDNMELGCKLIEKAATEKAVQDVDETLSQGLSARRKHREQTGGQPYYDLAVLGNDSKSYPAALPEPLRPQRGGLRPEQLRVYDAFHRMSRQAVANNLGQVGVKSDPESKGPIAQRLNLEALNQIAAKIDSSVTSLLSAAGARAPEVTLSMLPSEHEVRQLLAAVQQVVPRALSEQEKKSALGFAQGIFRRLYELDLSEPLRLEALVALLEKMNDANPELGNDLGTWTTYAPTDSEVQRKLHRTVLLLLVRSNLVSPQELDGFLSTSSDNGRNPVWVEFSLLFIRTAFLERIASPGDFPKLMELMTNVAEGRSQASPQVTQTLRKPILRMLEEVRATPVAGQQFQASSGNATKKSVSADQSTILSSASLANLVNGARVAAMSLESFARKDLPNAKQQVTSLLDSWIRVHNEAASNEKALVQYIQLLQQFGVGKTDEETERFFRLSTQIVVDAVVKTSPNGGDSTTLQYDVIDIYSRLIPILFRYLNSGGGDEQVVKQRIALLNNVLGVTVRCMMWDYECTKDSGSSWDQRPWFRLLLNFVSDLNSPDALHDTMKVAILGVFGTAFHVSQPLVVPGFAFAWLELVSHRSFMPNLLLLEGDKGFAVFHQLIVDMLLFLEPHLRNSELTPPIKKFYEGTLRVFVLLLHDFPSFLAGYHLSLCNIIPENCVQLRNVVLSAVPKGMTLPDPFTPNLKIDSLPEVSQSPVILSNVMGPLKSLSADLDSFLKDRQQTDFVNGLLPRLFKRGTREIDCSLINSLVLYIGMHGINRLQNSQAHQSLGQTPELEIIQKLMELDDHGRYMSLNAIANHLRYPSSHTHYFSCVTLFLFSDSKSVAVKEQITRVLLERLILHRPHPWGLLITFIELIKNQRYNFWSHPFTRCATEIEKVFESVARSCMTPGSQRGSLAIVGESQQ